MPSQELETLVAKFLAKAEGCDLNAYPDTGGVWTIGIGSTYYLDGTRVKEGDTCTLEQAYEYLNHHLEKEVYPFVDDLCAGCDVPDKVYVALASLAYNIGWSFVEKESFLKCILTQDRGTFEIVGKSIHSTGLASVMISYNKQRINGVLTPVRGLTNRRIAEIKYMLDLE